MLIKNSDPNRIFRLIELEKIAENRNRLGGRCKDVFELIKLKRKEIVDKKNELANPPKFVNSLSHSSLNSKWSTASAPK